MTRTFAILVIEDDLSILTGLSMNLRLEGYTLLQAQDGKTGLQQAIDGHPDLIILDVMLPEFNGYEVVKELRRRGNPVPVLMLSAKGTEQDKILGLEAGADDYLAKPFGLQELLARVKAALRRRFQQSEIFEFSDVVVDLMSKQVTRAGKSVELTAQEFRLLAYFISRVGRIFSREELISGVWGYDYQGTSRTVDNFVSQLRQKLEPDPEDAKHFQTVRGMGYKFEKSPAD